MQGISDFDALHSNRHNEEAQLYAFDLPGGDDLRDVPLFERKALLSKLLKGRPDGCWNCGISAVLPYRSPMH